MEILETLIQKKVDTPLATITYLKQHLEEEKTDGFSTISMTPVNHLLQLEKKTVTSRVSRSQIKQTSANGIDAAVMIQSVLLRESKMSTVKAICANYMNMGIESHEKFLMTKFQKWVKKHFPKYEYLYHIEHQNELEKHRKLYAKILLCSNMIAVNSRRGGANFIIVNGAIAAEISDHASFSNENSTNRLNHDVSPFCIGALAGIAVFIDPFMKYNDNRIIMGRSSSTQGMTGVFYVYTEPALSSFVDPETMGTINVLEMHDKIFNTPGIENSFLTINITFEKKPFWKKILSL